MKRSLKKLLSFTVRDPENNGGRVKDFLLDEEHWIIRYLAVDFGPEFMGKRVLVSNRFLEQPDWQVYTFPITRLKSDISQSPSLNDKLPVSRKYEEALNQYYKQMNYWNDSLSTSAAMELYPSRPLKVSIKKIEGKDIDSNLHSFIEVDGYRVMAQDQIIGQVADFIIDDEDWQIVYAIIDTAKWMPWKHKVVVPINLFDEISYVNNQIITQINAKTIKNSPTYDDNTHFDKEYEVKLFDFFIEKLEKEI